MKILERLVPVLFALMLFWVFGRFASADPSIAENSLWLIMVWGVFAIAILPRKKWKPTVPWIGSLIVALILTYGWFMIANAKAFFDLSEFGFQELTGRFWEWGPGTVAKKASVPIMMETTGLFLVFFAAVRARETRSWKTLLAVLPILGSVITMVGLYHRVIEAPSVWFIDQRHPPTFFAPFVYNGHAGAYLNFAGAIGFGFWVAACARRHTAMTLGWAILTAMCFLGSVATGSKGTALVLLITLGLCLWAHRRRLLTIWRDYREGPGGMRLEGRIFAIASVFLILVFGAVGVQKLIVRMDDFIEDARDGSAGTVEGRKEIMRVMWKMSAIDEGSWFGFGPGSFATVVPFFLANEDPPVRGRWLYGHSDPLQLVVEWGYIGAILWMAFAVGALVCGRKTIKSSRDSSSKDLTRGIMIGLGSMAIHSCFDFPFGILSLELVALFVCGLLWGGAGSREKLTTEK